MYGLKMLQEYLEGILVDAKFFYESSYNNIRDTIVLIVTKKTSLLY